MARRELHDFLKKQVARQKSLSILKNAGLPIPEELKNKVRKRVRSKLGTLALATNGMIKNAPLATVRRFEENVGGKEVVAEVLTMLQGEGKLSEKEQMFLEHLQAPGSRRKSLARIITEVGVNPMKVMSLYTKGCIEIGKMEAAIEAHKGLPQLVKNLNSHALSEAGDVCILCAGTGQVAFRAGVVGGNTSQRECGKCMGLGRQLEPSELKKFATEKLLEVTKMVEKGGGVTVQTNVGVQVPLGGSVLEKVMGAADEVLYRRGTAEVVDAEVVKEGENV